MNEQDFKKMNEIIDLYVDSEHPINEIISAMKDNLWDEFMDNNNEENLSTFPEGNSDKSEETNKDFTAHSDSPKVCPKCHSQMSSYYNEYKPGQETYCPNCSGKPS